MWACVLRNAQHTEPKDGFHSHKCIWQVPAAADQKVSCFWYHIPERTEQFQFARWQDRRKPDGNGLVGGRRCRVGLRIEKLQAYKFIKVFNTSSNSPCSLIPRCRVSEDHFQIPSVNKAKVNGLLLRGFALALTEGWSAFNLLGTHCIHLGRG